MHPVIDEILATRDVANVSPGKFRDWQRALRDEIGPRLDELDAREIAAGARD